MVLKKVRRPVCKDKKINTSEKSDSINNNHKEVVLDEKSYNEDESGELSCDKTSTKTIRIKKIKRNIDTEQYSSILSYSFKGHRHELEVKRSSYLGRREIVKLQDYGLDVTEKNADRVISHLRDEEAVVPITYAHSNVGFSTFEDKFVFKHFRGIGVDSSYDGKLEIKPTGEYGTWFKAVFECVKDNAALQTALVIGFSSAITGLMNLKSNFDSLVVHMAGDSTTGKTTAAMLAISPWGNPSTKTSNGLASTWNATENAIFSRVVGNYGLAMLFDEISMNDSMDFTKFIYRFAGNKDKSRLDKELKYDDAGRWGTTIISNGEFSVLEKSKKNTGAQLRILEFYNVMWTKDAESAEAIKQSILNNYGHAGAEFVRLLLKTDVSQIYDEIRKDREYIIKQMKEEGVDDKYVPRRSWQLAVLMYTAAKVQELLRIPLDIIGIWDFLANNEKQSISNRDLQKNAFEYFLEQVNINYKKFLRSDSLEATNDKNVNNPGNDIIGKINVLKNKSYNEICIFPELFRKLMKDGGFEDHQIILKKWKEEGMLDSEADRYTRKRKIIENAGAVAVYVIRVVKDELFNQ